MVHLLHRLYGVDAPAGWDGDTLSLYHTPLIHRLGYKAPPLRISGYATVVTRGTATKSESGIKKISKTVAGFTLPTKDLKEIIFCFMFKA